MTMERLWLPKPYARCQRLKEHVSENGLRIQRESPTHVMLQLRVRSKNASTSIFPEAGIITTCTLSKKEVLEVAEYLTQVAEELRGE